VDAGWLRGAIAVWSGGYALYRGYYAAGGTWGLPGVVRAAAHGQFMVINAAAVVVLLVAAAVPFVTNLAGPADRMRQLLSVLCWLAFVGCCMHAVVDGIDRVLSLSGELQVTYPFTLWESIDRRAADLQDLLGNEPWFLVEGVLFGALGWANVDPPHRRSWLFTALAAIAALTVLGVLSATGVIGRFVVG
ncbi:MAG TPA: hypothetical protein VGI84_02330, partial [Pseudonocardiaceae bacterium]